MWLALWFWPERGGIRWLPTEGRRIPCAKKGPVNAALPRPRQSRQAGQACRAVPRHRADAHRQGAGARRAVLAPRGRALDRGRPRRRQRPGAENPGADVGPTDKIVVDGKPLPAAEPPRLWRYHKPRGLVTTHKDPRGPPHRVRRAAQADAARHLHRPARLQYGGPAAAHQRRRARPPPGAAVDRLAAPLSRARARLHHAGGARQAEGRHRDQGRALRPHRSRAGKAAGHQCVAAHRPARGQEPRGAHHPGDAWAWP